MFGKFQINAIISLKLHHYFYDGGVFGSVSIQAVSAFHLIPTLIAVTCVLDKFKRDISSIVGITFAEIPFLLILESPDTPE